MKFYRIIQIFLCFVLSAYVADAQSGSYTVTLSLDNVTLEEAIAKIEQTTRYSFFYDSSTIDLKQKVSLQAKQMDISEALRQMLSKIPVTFEIANRQIVLIPTKPVDARNLQEMITVKGTVSEKGTGERLVGAVISIKGYVNLHTITDENGQYSITAPANAMMRAEVMGMYPVELYIGGRTNIPLILEPDVISLEGTVFTGYQTLSADRATGSFGMVDAKVMQEKPIANLQSMLEGQVAGLNVDNDGNITIRGISTFNASSKPLVVVDGFPVEETMHDSELFAIDNSIFENINADNIESITVLKDAVAASIYGARAANGVIVITTKKGHAGSTKVSYKGTFSAKSKPTTKDLNMATSAEALDGFEQLYNSMSMYYMPGYANYISAGYYWWMRDNGMMSADEANAAVEAMRKNDYFGEVDKYLFRPELTHQHNINISGGNEMNTFNVAANYQGTRGNFVFAGNRRITVDMRDDLRLNKVVSLSLGMNLNYATSHTPVYNPVYGGMEYASGKLFDFSELVSVFNPNMSFFEEDGTPKSVDMIVPMIKQNYSYISGLKSTELNLWEDLQQSTYSTQDFQSRINGTVNLFLARGLTANIGGNWQRGNYLCRQYYQAESFYARRVYNSGISLLNTDDRIYPDGGIVNEKRNNNQSWTVRGQVNFDRDFGGGKHKVTAIAGGEIRRTTYDNTILPTRYGYNEIAGTFSPVDTYGILAGDYMGTTLASMYGVMYMSMGETPTNGSIALMDNRYVSYYANGSYELNDKYLVSGSVRMDLTNFFGTDPKYRYRPIWSVGGTWKISKEDFFDVSWVDRLYLRGSYGINGNIALNEGPFLILGAQTDYNGSSYSQYTQGDQYKIISAPNSQLRWEKTRSINLGVDAAFFGNRWNLSFDAYHKLSSDLLAPDQIDPTTGFSSLTVNAGEIINKGFELTTDVDIIRSGKFKWNSGLTLAYNHNEVKSYNVDVNYWYDYIYGALQPGYPTSVQWGVKYAGYDESGMLQIEGADGSKKSILLAEKEDVQALGQTLPKYDLSWTNRFKFGNVDFSFMFVSKLGHILAEDYFSGKNVWNRHVADSQTYKPDSMYPTISFNNYYGSYLGYTDAVYKSANFLRLREVNLGYNFSSSFLKKIGFESARAYIQGRNLLTVTAKGVSIDPELKYTSYKTPKEINLGLQFTF